MQAAAAVQRSSMCKKAVRIKQYGPALDVRPQQRGSTALKTMYRDAHMQYQHQKVAAAFKKPSLQNPAARCKTAAVLCPSLCN